MSIPARLVATFHLGTPRFGVWCQACMLPAAYEVDVLHLTASGVRTVGTLRRCHDCGAKADR